MKADGTCETRDERVAVVLMYGLSPTEAASQIVIRDEQIARLHKLLLECRAVFIRHNIAYPGAIDDELTPDQPTERVEK